MVKMVGNWTAALQGGRRSDSGDWLRSLATSSSRPWPAATDQGSTSYSLLCIPVALFVADVKAALSVDTGLAMPLTV